MTRIFLVALSLSLAARAEDRRIEAMPVDSNPQPVPASAPQALSSEEAPARSPAFQAPERSSGGFSLPVHVGVMAGLSAPRPIDGEIYVRTENPLGLMGYYVVGDGGKNPYRMKMRTASFSNVSVIPAMLPGALLPDLIAILGSIFFVVGDVDR